MIIKQKLRICTGFKFLSQAHIDHLSWVQILSFCFIKI